MNWNELSAAYMQDWGNKQPGAQNNPIAAGLLNGGPVLPIPSMRQPFPQYGGNSRTAQMLNSYMGGLLSRRTPYMPPNVSRQGMGATAGPGVAGGVPSYGSQPVSTSAMPAWAPPSGYMFGHSGGLIPNNYSLYDPSANG